MQDSITFPIFNLEKNWITTKKGVAQTHWIEKTQINTSQLTLPQRLLIYIFWLSIFVRYQNEKKLYMDKHGFI